MSTAAEMRDGVRTAIREAFASTPYPGDKKVVENATDFDPEARDLENAFRGKAWQDVDAAMIREYKDGLPLFTPAGFRYYLPAYMLGVIDHRDEVDVAVDSAVFNLTPPKTRRGWQWTRFKDRTKQFNAQERGALRAFLELMLQHDIEESRPPSDRVKLALSYWREG